MKVASDEEAIGLMNDSAFGLTASIWTADAEAAVAIGDRVATGTWFMNRCDYLDPALAWTGVKNSGRGCYALQDRLRAADPSEILPPAHRCLDAEEAACHDHRSQDALRQLELSDPDSVRPRQPRSKLRARLREPGHDPAAAGHRPGPGRPAHGARRRSRLNGAAGLPTGLVQLEVKPNPVGQNVARTASPCSRRAATTA